MSQTVLIVDDDPVQRRLLEATVRRLGYGAIVAESGEAALSVLRAGDAADLIILDLVMPGLDGFGVLAALRESAIELPVIVQTARGGIDTTGQPDAGNWFRGDAALFGGIEWRPTRQRMR